MKISAQTETKYLDYNYQETSKRNARYTMNVYTLNDTVYKDIFNKKNNHLIVRHKHQVSKPEWVHNKNFRDNGSLESQGFFMNKLKTGEWNYYDSEGNISVNRTFDKNKEIYQKKFYKNGILRKEVAILSDNFHGACKYYSKEGWLLLQGSYFKNRRKGDFIYYNKEGLKTNVFWYSNNLLNGYDSIFINGRLNEIVTFHEGVRNGPVFYFNEDSVFKNAYYKNDTLINGPLKSEFKDSNFKSVEVMPEFPQGEAAMMKYIAENMKYPEAAINSAIEGTVRIKFTIRADGTIFDVNYINKEVLEFGCERAAIEVIEDMPDWKPGMQNGTPVPVYFNIPIRFRLF